MEGFADDLVELAGFQLGKIISDIEVKIFGFKFLNSNFSGLKFWGRIFRGHTCHVDSFLFLLHLEHRRRLLKDVAVKKKRHQQPLDRIDWGMILIKMVDTNPLFARLDVRWKVEFDWLRFQGQYTFP